jgi:hypothetical protein
MPTVCSHSTAPSVSVRTGSVDRGVARYQINLSIALFPVRVCGSPVDALFNFCCGLIFFFSLFSRIVFISYHFTSSHQVSLQHFKLTAEQPRLICHFYP